MISQAPLYGLTQIEQILTGFIAGFHHASAARSSGLTATTTWPLPKTGS